MVVNGSDVVVTFFDDGQWKHYGCGLNVELRVDTSMIETSTTGSGDYATFVPQKHTATATISGLVNLFDASLLTLADLRSKQLTKTLLNVRYTRTDGNGHEYLDAFDAYISSSSDNGQLNTAASFTIELQVTGAITQLIDGHS